MTDYKMNTGYRNTGHCNTGDCNTGDYNTGDYNTGYRNTGDCNTGNWNTGNWNTGDCNIGDYNTGHRNTGYFNTITPSKILIFNKECNYDYLVNCDQPDFMYNLILTEWVNWDNMLEYEKINNPHNEHIGGFLRKYDYKQAWRNAWDKADLEDRKKILSFPNFDNDIFLEISGIDVNKEISLICCKCECHKNN